MGERFFTAFIFLFVLIPIGLISLIFSPIIIMANYFWEKSYQKKLRKLQSEWQGKFLFVYTSKKSSQKIIENEILTKLDSSIVPVLLEGKLPISTLDPDSVSMIIYNIKNIGFPSLIHVTKDGIRNTSFKHEFYNHLNQELELNDFADTVNQEMETLSS